MFKSQKNGPRSPGGPDAPKRRRGRRAAKIATAMRKIGLDENCLAAKYHRLLERLEHRGGTAEKLFFEAVKECAKLLGVSTAPPRPAEAAPLNVPIRLVHDVPRPVCPAPAQGGAAPGRSEAAEESTEESAADPAHKPFPN